ncbi:MAG: dephospho-CoA kinase [Chloroflexi bacterium]|nr:dephospho-CoA kinase [Chloroflexi bacterium CFX1]MCK6568399.1 dephospho-CoA kinase [Anaerolineales bacterium]MCQ3953157.1 dephospho-CoA kinase [Chloroflexota bacterium]MDL1919525.1 dephospho-CoA kinase [Chloroflexi bacterium CFX5]NUQ58181.1 dephospho-CoA kinase [Anaerolineales bacterium]
MSNLSGKFVIGLTGNIATGKSVVRRMLEHLGAYTIDADALTHRAYAKGAPGHQQVIDRFGKWLLNRDGEIDRRKLGNLVFSDPEAMRQLEEIVHPLVKQATELLIQRASQPVIVIEAIKLLEGDLRKTCDTVWVTNAPEATQVERLMRKRGFTREQAQERVRAQSAQSIKVNMANMVITNTGSYDDLWKQVNEAWKETVPGARDAPTDTAAIKRPAGSGALSTHRGKPKHAASIADLVTRLSKGKRKMTADEVMESFGDKAFMLLQSDGQVVGVAGWQVENLVTRTTDIFLEGNLDIAKALETLVGGVEAASGELQSEASLIFATDALAAQDALWQKLGYEKRAPESLGAQAWQEAAAEAAPANSVLFFKQLRQDRVLRPI